MITRSILSVLLICAVARDGWTGVAPADRNVTRSAERQIGQRRFPPRDDSASISSFKTFHDSLLNAALQGDAERILMHTTPYIRLSEGTAEARLFLEHSGVAAGRPWTALVNALRLGCAEVSAREFVAPYLVEDWADSPVAMGRVRLRAAPSPTSPVLMTLHYHAVEVLSDHGFNRAARSLTDHEAWAHVRLADGATGYVYVGLLRWAGDPRFYFELVGTEWKLVGVAEGD